MAWVTLTSAVYTGSYNNNGNMTVTLQYNDASITVTSLELRCIGDPRSNVDDTFYVWSTDGTIGRICYLRKSGADAYTNVNSFTVTKNKEAKSFSVPELYICNDGQHRAASAYTDTNGRGHYAYFTSGRVNFKSVLNEGGTIVPTGFYITKVGSGSINIEDHQNNSYTITAEIPPAGTNNPITSATFSYTNAAGSSDNLSYSQTDIPEGGLTITKLIEFTPTNTADTRQVYGSLEVIGKYNNPGIRFLSPNPTSINQYIEPTPSGQPKLTDSSFKNGRLTLKTRWTYEWEAATPRNNNTNVGDIRYYVSLSKKSPGSSSLELIDDCEIAETSYSIDPIACGFKAKDKVRLSVAAFSKKGTADKNLWASEMVSPETEVQHSGVCKVNIGTVEVPNFIEGQVFVYVANDATNKTFSWKEAEVVKVYTNSGNWEESE